MGISDVRRAFVDELGRDAQCVAFTMHYADGGQSQVLRASIIVGGEARTVERTVPALADLASEARRMAAEARRTQ
ncbi:MAG TPA: hypothetical protein VNK52_16130 [Hyphomicrobiaceae bacterium]|nr:hypothetical protein [Hyphomicrobiaceae bacterium]